MASGAVATRLPCLGPPDSLPERARASQHPSPPGAAQWPSYAERMERAAGPLDNPGTRHPPRTERQDAGKASRRPTSPAICRNCPRPVAHRRSRSLRAAPCPAFHDGLAGLAIPDFIIGGRASRLVPFPVLNSDGGQGVHADPPSPVTAAYGDASSRSVVAREVEVIGLVVGVEPVGPGSTRVGSDPLTTAYISQPKIPLASRASIGSSSTRRESRPRGSLSVGSRRAAAPRRGRRAFIRRSRNRRRRESVRSTGSLED
jgi:hypothetical protein